MGTTGLIACSFDTGKRPYQWIMPVGAFLVLVRKWFTGPVRQIEIEPEPA